MDITEEMVDAYIAAFNALYTPESSLIYGPLDALRAGLAAVAPLIAAQALRSAAEEIRSELVCCDVYERVAPELQAKNLAGEWAEVTDETTGDHQICYWGEAAAMIVTPR